MQMIGIVMLFFVVQYGFSQRDMTQISAFDPHALTIVLCGSMAAILLGSRGRDSLKTLLCLRELLPIPGGLGQGSAGLEADRARFVELWRAGQRAQAVQLAEQSPQPVLKLLLSLVLQRASEKQITSSFLETRHRFLREWQPASSNWSLLAKLGPSMGMVGTITGMIQLFKSMGDDNLNIGAAMSLALVATLYGIAFGAGIAGPIGHFLRGLIEERLGALDRCRQSAIELADAAAPRGV